MHTCTLFRARRPSARRTWKWPRNSGQKDAEAKLEDKVKKGGQGVWDQCRCRQTLACRMPIPRLGEMDFVCQVVAASRADGGRATGPFIPV